MTQETCVLTIKGRSSGPDFVAKSPSDNGKWMNVGVAFFNPKTETFTIYLENYSIKGKVVLFKN